MLTYLLAPLLAGLSQIVTIGIVLSKVVNISYNPAYDVQMSKRLQLLGDFVPQTTYRGSAHGPRWETAVPQTPCAPTSKSWLRHCSELTHQRPLNQSPYLCVYTGPLLSGFNVPIRGLMVVMMMTNYPSLAYEQLQNSPVSPPEQKSISPFSRMP